MMLDEDWSLLVQIYEATTCSKSKHDIPDVQEIHLFLKNIGPLSAELITQCAIDTMNPILFATKYRKDIFTKWSRESGMLESKGFLAEDDVIDKVTKKKILIFYKVFANISIIFQACHIYGTECGTFRKNFSTFLSRMEKSLKRSLLENESLLRDDPFFKCFSGIAEQEENQLVLNAFLIGMHNYFKSMQWDGSGLTISTEVKNTELEEPLSEELRNRGNEEFKNKSYYTAIQIYSKAILINRYRYILYGNRSQAYIKVQRWDEAELDARRALLLNPSWFKGYYRLAYAYKGQERIHEAHIIIDHMKKSCTKKIPNDDYREIYNFQETLKKECPTCCSIPRNKLRIKKMESEKKERDIKPKQMKHTEELHSDQKYQTNPESHETYAPEDFEEIQDEDKQPSALDIFKNYCKEGSQAFHCKDYELSIQKYKDATKLLNSGVCSEISSSEVFILKYCLSKSLVASNYRKTIKEAISILENIKDNEGLFISLTFYGIAKAYAKLNKYKDALPIISQALSTLKPGSLPKHLYSYPQHSSTIEETDPTFLQEKLQDLQAQCTYAPPPIGTCRYNQCPLELDIYPTNPEYKGYYLAKCSDNCVLHYHPSCWKNLLASLGSEHQKKTDKDMLSHDCFTPDCCGTFSSIKNFDTKGDIVKVFELPHKVEPTKKKKTKTEKKAELKKQQQLKKKGLQHDSKHIVVEEQRRTSLSQQDDDETDPQCEGKPVNSKTRTFSALTPVPPSNPCKPHESVASNAHVINGPLYNVNDEPEKILKKTDVQEETVSKKKKKKKTKRLLSMEKPNIEIPHIYHSDKYQERLKKLEEVKRAAEEGMDIKYIERYSTMVTEAPSETVSQPQATGQSIDNLQQMEEIETILISFLLTTNGPVSLEDLHLHKALASLPSECQQYLEQIGGLKSFVGKSSQFVLVNGMIHFATQVHEDNTLHVYSSNGCDDMATLDGIDDLTEPEIVTDQDDDIAFDLSSENEEYMSDDSINDVDMVPHHNNFDLTKHSAMFYEINKKVESILNNVRLVIDSNVSIDELPFLNNTTHPSLNKSTNSHPISPIEHVSSHYSTISHLSEQKLDVSNQMKKLSSDVLFHIMTTIKECNDEKAIQIFAKIFWDDLNKAFPSFYKDATGRFLMDQSPIFLEEAKKNKEQLQTLNKQKEALELELKTMLENHAQLKKTKNAEINSLREALSNQETLFQKKCEEMGSFKSELESQKNKWELERISLLEDLKKIQTALKEAQYQKADLQLKYTKAQRGLDASKEEVEKLERDLSSIQKRFGRVFARARNAEELVLQSKKQEGLNFVNRPLQQTREKISSLTTELENACKFKDAAKRLEIQKLLNEWKLYELKLMEEKNDFLARIEREELKVSRNEEPDFVELPKISIPPHCENKDELGIDELPSHQYDLLQMAESERKDEEEELASEASAAMAQASRSTSISEMDDELDLPLALSSSATSHDTVWHSESASVATPAPLTEQEDPIEDPLELPCATPLDAAIEIPTNVLSKPPPSTKPKVALKPSDKSSQKVPSSYFRLIILLEREYPKLTRNQLDDYIRKYRASQTKLSGKKIPQIVAAVSGMIEQDLNASKVSEPPKQPAKSDDAGWKTVKSGRGAWNRLPPKKPTFTGGELEQCVICIEEIDPSQNEKLECGHNFHNDCIRLWLRKNKSTCPMCNTHVLLPDEFPQL